MKFTKMHGAGNDYVYVNGYVQSLDWPVISEKISDRHKGIGATALLLPHHLKLQISRCVCSMLMGQKGKCVAMEYAVWSPLLCQKGW